MVENYTSPSNRPTDGGNRWIGLGAMLALMGVGCGAFGAHGLPDYLAQLLAGDAELMARRLDNWKTAADYQMIHAIGMVLAGMLMQRDSGRCCLSLVGWAFLAGILLFSGLLYLLVLTDIRWLGAIVPLGGISMMVGWGALGLSFLTGRTAAGDAS